MSCTPRSVRRNTTTMLVNGHNRDTCKTDGLLSVLNAIEIVKSRVFQANSPNVIPFVKVRKMKIGKIKNKTQLRLQSALSLKLKGVAKKKGFIRK